LDSVMYTDIIIHKIKQYDVCNIIIKNAWKNSIA
jgi:hypothetical protein